MKAAWFFAGVFMGLVNICSAATTIHHCMQGDRGYAVDLLKLALSQNSADIQLQRNDWYCSEKRKIKSALENKIDVMWAGASQQLDDQLIPVRIPIFKGLTGYRVLLIRAGEQSRFDRVKSLSDFRTFSLGQGEAWIDTDIFRSAGFRVVTSHNFELLPNMLAYKRFDAFPRGIQQVWNDLQRFSDLNLAIEKNLAVHYRLPAYFYFSQKSEALARDVEQGLEKLIDSGEFDRFFYGHPLIKDGLQQVPLKNRLVFDIPNPDLPRGVPIARKELWFTPE